MLTARSEGEWQADEGARVGRRRPLAQCGRNIGIGRQRQVGAMLLSTANWHEQDGPGRDGTGTDLPQIRHR